MTNLYMTALAQSGKDTVAGIIAERTGHQLYALARPIKDIMCALFMWGDEHREGSYKEIPMVYRCTPDSVNHAGMIYNSYGLDEYEPFHDCWEKLVDLFGIEIKEDDYGYARISPRQAFQGLGTDWGRSVDNEIWLKIAPTENVIITDVRFDNEGRFFRNKGFQGIQIIRPNFGKIASSGHASENGIDPLLVDMVINNDKGLKQLNRKAKYIAEELIIHARILPETL